jgi:predicted Zn-dependent protease
VKKHLTPHSSHGLIRLLFVAASLVAGGSPAMAQRLVAPAEVVLYLHADLKSTDFVRPLVCALQTVLTAPVVTQISSLPLGPELLATPAQFDVGKVADVFIRTTAAEGSPPSFKYLIIPHDLKFEPLRYVFSTSFGDETTPHHVGVLSTARLDQGGEVTARRAYKLILKSIARVAGLRSPEACILSFPNSLDELDRKSSAFCPDDRATLIRAGILNAREGEKGTDCSAISQRGPAGLLVAAARGKP